MATASRACPACQTPLPEAAQFCMSCGTATPTDPGVPPRVASTGAFEVDRVTSALAGRYRVERVLGEGGMATVYLAEDQKHRRKVAVKVMRPELAATLGADRFLREVQIAAQLSHPHVLPMHDSGEADGLLYYVMPYVEGETLKERLARDGALPPDEALRLAREIAEALAYAHRRGIVHRDIKPANILLGEGHALVADFGIARAVDEGGGEALTKTGLAIGTPQYMSPEQAAGEREVDGRADVYALGAILYEMLSGQPPFTGANPRAILTKSLTQAPAPLSQVRAGLTPAVETVVAKALQKQAEARYPSATEFVAAIDAVRTQSSGAIPAISTSQATQVLAPPVGAAAPWWRSTRALVGAGVAVAALAAFWMLGRGSAGRAGGGSGGPRGNRVAVLPFEAPGAPAEASIADGIADEVRGKLAGLQGLSVIASASARQYRGSTKSPQVIAQELGVDYVLTGTVRFSGDGAARRLQVVPELIDGRTGDVTWQQTFDGSLTDVFAVQSRIASQVTGALGVALAATDTARIAARPTENLAAYQAYLRGTNETGLDPAALRRAIAAYEQAVAIDSNFAAAWAELSNRTALLFANGNRDPAQARRSREALERLSALEPGSARTHVVRSRYLLTVEGDAVASRREVDLALRLDPRDAAVLARAGALDAAEGNFGSAVTRFEQARALDPRSTGTLSQLIDLYIYMDRTGDAVGIAEGLAAVAPQDVDAAHRIAMSHAAAGDLEGARSATRAAIARGIPAPTVAAQFAGTNETGWLLDDETQRLALRLTPSAFDDDRAWWAQSLATLCWQRGDTALARAFADSAIAPTRAQLSADKPASQLHGLIALMYAYRGQAREARAEAALGMERAESQTLRSYNALNAAKVEIALGDRDAAVALIQRARSYGTYETPSWLRIDPTYASLKGHPGFEQLLQPR
jgi:serine/threonine-protein kinase